MNKSLFFIKEIVIEDIGHRKGYSTITNDAENVVKELIEAKILRLGTRLLYIDSEGRKDELLHDGKKFIQYRFLPQQEKS